MGEKGANPATIPDLVGDIGEDIRILLKEEIRRARTQMQEEWSRTKLWLSSIAVAASLAMIGGALFLLGFSRWIANAVKIPTWQGDGMVGFGLFFAGLVVLQALRKRRPHFFPQQTLQSLKEDFQWVRK